MGAASVDVTQGVSFTGNFTQKAGPEVQLPPLTSSFSYRSIRYDQCMRLATTPPFHTMSTHWAPCHT